MLLEQNGVLYPPDASTISYTLLRYLGLMLDALSAQGLNVWQAERQAWRWAWAATSSVLPLPVTLPHHLSSSPPLFTLRHAPGGRSWPASAARGRRSAR